MADIEGRKLEPFKEYYVLTPNGSKSYRFIDVVALDANRQVVEAYQVGKQTKGGIPVSRERVGITDITRDKKFAVPVNFIPYNNIGK